MDEIPYQYVSNPLVSWGILISCLGAFQDNFKEAPERLGFGRTNIGINFPFTQPKAQAIVLGLNGLRVENSGMYSAELTDPRNQLLFSYGSITVDVYTPNHNSLMTMVDYITQCYLLNLFNKNTLAYPGAERSYVAIGYAGGKIEWGRFGFENPPHTQESYGRLFTSSSQFPFKAEHHISTDLARVSAVDLEAVPLNLIV